MVNDYADPITSIIIIADKNRCKPYYQIITRAHDDNSYDADVWKDSLFSISRIYRYIAVSKSLPVDAPAVNVVSDITILNERDNIPPGYTPIEFTADTKEKALRKKQLCVRYSPRDSAIDAVTDIQILARQKKPSSGYTLAGDIDGLYICFKFSVINPDFGKRQQKPYAANGETSGMYPGIPYPLHPNTWNEMPGQVQQSLQIDNNPFHQSTGGRTGIDDVPFELAPSLKSQLKQSTNMAVDSIENIPDRISNFDSEDFNYSFETEQSVMMSALITN